MRITGHPFLRGPGMFNRFRCSIEGDGGGGGGGPPPGDTKTTDIVAPWAAAGDKPWMIGEAAKAQPWFAAIPEAPVKELITQKAYANPATLATAYYNLNKITSAEESQKILIPGKDAKPEAWDAVYTKLGRPVYEEGYNEVFKFDDKVKVDEATVKFGKSLALKLGLNPTQAKTMADAHNEFVATRSAEVAELNKKANDIAVGEVMSKWGAEADALIAGGQRVYKALGLDEKFVAAIEGHIGAAPLVELLARMGKASAEGTFKGGGTGGGNDDPNAMTPEAAAAEITKLNNDKDFQAIYTNRMHGGNKDAVQKMNLLFARAGDKAPV